MSSNRFPTGYFNSAQKCSKPIAQQGLWRSYDERRECGKDGWEDEDDNDYFLDDEAKHEELEVEECTSDGQWIPYPGFARSDIDVNTVVADDGTERSDDGEDAIRSFFQDLLYGHEPMKR